MLHQGLLRKFLLHDLLPHGLRPLLLLLLLRCKGKKPELHNVAEAGVEAEAEPETAAQTVNAAKALSAAETVPAPDEPGAAAVLEVEVEAEQEHEPAVPATKSHEVQISSSCSKTCPRWRRMRFVAGL